jgi:DNA-binding NarL/FixJ family response regulator
VRSTRAGGRDWLLTTRNEEVAAARIEEASEEARLTPKEKEVFTLVLKRRTNAEIASELHIILCTVKNHVSRILLKLGLKTRREIS